MLLYGIAYKMELTPAVSSAVPEDLLQFDFSRYPYLTVDLPAQDGLIRQEPSDFQVTEVPAYLPSGEGDHLYLYIQKQSLTTRAVVEGLRDGLGIAEKDIGVAGLKDKHALTRQWFSLPAKYQNRLEGFCLAGAEIMDTGLHTNKLRVGHLQGNQFRILLRSPQAQLDTVLAVLKRLAELGVPNYYGPQRFGINGLNPIKGYALVTGQKVHAIPWLKKFLVASLQSLLFNDWLALRLDGGTFHQVVKGDVAKKHDSGGEFVVEDAETENPRALRLEISAMGALYGKKYREAHSEAKAIEDEILAKYALSRTQFRARHGDRRMIRFPLTQYSAELSPEGIWVNFFLPKGAYATAVLREIMKRDPENAGETEVINEVIHEEQ
jgi:tRNA pseudouridine13 synthase